MSAPPPDVLAAFGTTAPPVLLPGGQGGTWRAGDVVVKRAGLAAEIAWSAEILRCLPDSPEFRVARPVPAVHGGWLADGWAAWHAVTGEPDVTRVDDILAAGEAFHRALAELPRPGFLDHRDDPWTLGERIAFGDRELTGTEPMTELLTALAAARRPIRLPDQPVHGDLLGNVLFAPGEPPAIIDWPVYFRPATWALAVAVVDALTWCCAPASVAAAPVDEPAWDQLLLRAAMYRIATNDGFRRAGAPVREKTEHYAPVVALILGRC